MEAKQQHMLIEKAFVQAHYRPKSGLPGVSDRLRESFIRNTCETALMATLYPRTTVQIIIQEVQNCGGVSSIIESTFIIKVTLKVLFFCSY